MSRWNEAWQPLFERFGKLNGMWPTRGWTWDNRFNCVTSSFTVEQEKAARAAVAELFVEQWSASTIARAPAALREVAERTGGVRSGQVVLATATTAGLTGFGLWWPWGDGETISLRVGMLEADPAKEPYNKFRDLFGVTF